MVPRTCDHHITQVVRGQLTIIGLCPSCVMNHHVAEIKSTQNGLQRRGGIFASKEKALQEGQIQCKRHRAWTRKWRLAKIQCAKDLEFLESLRNSNPEMVGAEGIEAALDIWDHAKEECSRVPGCGYLEDVDAEITAEVLNGCGHDTDDTESPSNDSTVERSIDASEITGACFDETIFYEMDALASRLEQSLRLNSSTLVDGQTPQAVQQSPEDPNLSCTISIARAQSQPLNPPLQSTAYSPRSVLKRASLPHQPAKPRTTNRILVSESVTIMPCPTLDSYTNQPPESPQSHNTYTDAHHHRVPSAYHRRSASYEPATWTSPIGYEKINASHWRTDWDKYEALADRAGEDVDAETDNRKGDVDVDGHDNFSAFVRNERSSEDTYERCCSRDVDGTDLREIMGELDSFGEKDGGYE